MIASRTVAVFLSGCAVYVAVAACSGAAAPNDDAARDPSGEGGGPTITDPVPKADADPATSGSRLKVESLVGEDGSKQAIGWFDTQRNESCKFQLAEDGASRCLPQLDTDVRANDLGYGIYTFVDAACAERAFYVATNGSCPSHSRGKAFGYLEDECGGGLHVYTYGAPIDASAPLYYTTSLHGACKPMTAQRLATNVTFSGVDFFRGVAVPASSFVKGTLGH